MPVKNAKRDLFLSALLVNPTVKDAAASVRIPITTAFNILREQDFADEYERRKRQAVAEASDYLRLRINAAARIIDEIMNDNDAPPQTRLNAAKTLIDTAYKIIEQADIVTRIEALEAYTDRNGQ